jgi:Alpha-L-fucosidase
MIRSYCVSYQTRLLLGIISWLYCCSDVLLATSVVPQSTDTPQRIRLPPPSWEDLDARPLPAWYDDAKFGIFIHWGIFSVPSYGSEWFWMHWKGNHMDSLPPSAADRTNDDDDDDNPYEKFVQMTERPNFQYPEYASRFRAELYRPDEWAQAFAQAGAQYVVLTSKHHDGYCKVFCYIQFLLLPLSCSFHY